MPWQRAGVGGGKMASRMSRVCQGALGPSSPSMPLSPFSGEGCFNLSTPPVQTSDGLSRRLSPDVRLVHSVLIEESPQIRAQFIPERPRRILIDVKVRLSRQRGPIKVLETVSALN